MPTLNLGRVGFVNKGDWNISTTYKINDVVIYNNGTYASLQAHTGQTPISGGSVYWQEWIPQGSTALKPSGENLLINSNGLINQREYVSGTATTIANQYTVDRWRVVTSGQNLTFSTTNGVITFTAPADGVEQVIENLNIIGGSYVLTVGGTATAEVSESTDNVTYAVLTPVSGVYTVTGGKYVKIKFSGGTFSLPKFERGTIATPWTPYFGIFGGEVQACQRYLPSAGTGNSVYSGQAIATTVGVVIFPYKVPARTAPTGVMFMGTLSSMALTASGGNNIAVSAISFITAGDSSAALNISVASGLVDGNATNFSLASQKILFTGCEL